MAEAHRRSIGRGALFSPLPSAPSNPRLRSGAGHCCAAVRVSISDPVGAAMALQGQAEIGPGEGSDSRVARKMAPIARPDVGQYLARSDGASPNFDLTNAVIASCPGRAMTIEIIRVKHFNPDMTGWRGKEPFHPLPAGRDRKTMRRYFDGLTIRRTGPDTAESCRQGQRRGRIDQRGRAQISADGQEVRHSLSWV